MIACPKCGAEKITIATVGVGEATIDDKGVIEHEYGEFEWDPDTTAWCCEDDCGWNGTLDEVTGGEE